MTTTGRSGIDLAAKLLAKAESTDSEEEATSLALRAYSLVAEWLNERDRGTGGLRRRERRLLRDRRFRPRWLFGPEEPSARSAQPGSGRVAGGYRQFADDGQPPRRHIDFRL